MLVVRRSLREAVALGSCLVLFASLVHLSLFGQSPAATFTSARSLLSWSSSTATERRLGTLQRWDQFAESYKFNLSARLGRDIEQAKRDWNIHVDFDNLHSYAEHIESIQDRYFRPHTHPALTNTSSFLSNLELPAAKEMPKLIATTLGPGYHLFDQFKYWLEHNPDHAIVVHNDTSMESWIRDRFGPSSPVYTNYMALPEPVLKSDVFRYLWIMLEGGVYSDSDTAAVRPIREWLSSPRPPKDVSSDLLASMPALAAMNGDQEFLTKDPLEELRAFQSQPPSLIVAIENLCGYKGEDWRTTTTLARGAQVVQWTIAGAPSAHPVLMDVVGRSFDKAREKAALLVQAQAAHRRDEPPPVTSIPPFINIPGPSQPSKSDIRGQIQDILDWSGPGTFTDCLLTYLLVRWGFPPQALSLTDTDEGIRVGDVVILPHAAFQADTSEGFQLDKFRVWHGFHGSWKPASWTLT